MGSKPPVRSVIFCAESSPFHTKEDEEGAAKGIFHGHKMGGRVLGPDEAHSFDAHWQYPDEADGFTGTLLRATIDGTLDWYKGNPKTPLVTIDGPMLNELTGLKDDNGNPIDFDDAGPEIKAKLTYQIDFDKFAGGKFKDGLENLVLYYAYPEGGPNLNLATVLVRDFKAARLRPAHPDVSGTPGTDPTCPVATAERIFALPEGQQPPEDYFTVANLTWQAGAFVRNNDPEVGAWHTEDVTGNQTALRLTAKPTLTLNHGSVYHFDRWEWRTLNQTTKAPEPSEDPEYYMPAQDFAGIIAFYHYKGHQGRPQPDDGLIWVDVDPEGYKPVPTPPEGDWSRILHLAEQRIAYDLEQLARGVMRVFRHAPDTAGHGRDLDAPRVDAATRSRLVELAKLYPNDGGELERMLRTLHD